MTKAVFKRAALGALILSGALAASQAALADDGTRIYEVTITNLNHAFAFATAPGSGNNPGQPIAPSLFVTHGSDFSMFEVGEVGDPTDPRYVGLATMAETGAPFDLRDAVLAADGVSDTAILATGHTPPVLLAGESNTGTISASGNAKYFSAVGMLAVTNDAFYAVRGVELPKNGSVTVQAVAYDAGSEENTELFADVPGGGNDTFNSPTGNEENYIHIHAGIQGVSGGDISPANHDWKNPVVEITITRVQDDD